MRNDRYSERSEESLFTQKGKKREIPHFADSVRNDEADSFAIRGEERFLTRREVQRGDRRRRSSPQRALRGRRVNGDGREVRRSE
jgi:hypothetical protein